MRQPETRKPLGRMTSGLRIIEMLPGEIDGPEGNNSTALLQQNFVLRRFPALPAAVAKRVAELHFGGVA